MSEMVTILIADDHGVVRKSLKLLLEHQEHFKVVAEAETGEEAVAKARETHPDVAVLDVRMPGLSGIEACRQIVDTVPGCKVIVLTATADDAVLYAAIQAGALGYVLKRVGDNDLIHAVESVSRGEGFQETGAIAQALQQIYIDAQSESQWFGLSGREVAILGLVSQGLTNRQISIRLFLGEGAIRNYVSVILGKLSVANRAEAAAFEARYQLNAQVASD